MTAFSSTAATGELNTGFGKSGRVLSTEGHGRGVTRYEFDQTSPPVVFKDLVALTAVVSFGAHGQERTVLDQTRGCTNSGSRL